MPESGAEVATDINDLKRAVYERLTGEDDGRVCRDIPDIACNDQPGNFLTHAISLAATKTGDGLVDPKLVLPWLMGALGAPAWMTGLLVPIREAGALLPQLFTAGWIRARSQRKYVWAAGSLTQGLCVAGMGIAALLLDGLAAGASIVALLAVMACARSVCSVSYKDVLGKTVSKATRGTATGTASTIAAALVLLFGGLLSFNILTVSVPVIAGVLFVAGGLWMLAALLFLTLAEEPGATEGGGNPIDVVMQQFKLLWEDPQLTRFILTRGLLTGTALAPPFLLAMAGREGGAELGTLGPFVISGGLAAIASSYVWGRLSDVSSRRVLTFSAMLAAAILGVSAAIGFTAPELLTRHIIAPALLFVLMIAWQGVRLGRATHVVDMTDQDRRAAYTALSNTIIGVLLLAGGLFGVVAHFWGEAAVLLVFAAMSAVAIPAALGLKEVQQDG